jgi:hypothetical protein
VLDFIERFRFILRAQGRGADGIGLPRLCPHAGAGEHLGRQPPGEERLAMLQCGHRLSATLGDAIFVYLHWDFALHRQ